METMGIKWVFGIGLYLILKGVLNLILGFSVSNIIMLIVGVVALVLMLMDHIHYFFEFTGCIPEWFSMLACLSAPLFLFCTVEGFSHTHDRKRYFFRI